VGGTTRLLFAVPTESSLDNVTATLAAMRLRRFDISVRYSSLGGAEQFLARYSIAEQPGDNTLVVGKVEITDLGRGTVAATSGWIRG
jgi:hypothetical protein